VRFLEGKEEFLTCLERADDEEEVESCFAEHDQPFVERIDSGQLRERVIQDKPTRARRYIAEAGQELAEYASERAEHPEISEDYYDVHLAIGGQALWNAYQLLLEERKGEEITPEKGFQAIEEWSEEIGKKDPTWRDLYSKTYDLHVYGYDGGVPDRKVVEDITESASLMSKEIGELERKK